MQNPTGVTFSLKAIGQSVSVSVTATDSKGNISDPAKININVPKISVTYKPHPPSMSPNYLINDYTTASTDAIIFTTPSAPTLNLGAVTAAPVVKGLPASVTTDKDGMAKLTYSSKPSTKGIILTLDKQMSVSHDMLPADYLTTFLITEYVTIQDPGPANTTDVNQFVGGSVQHRYIVHSSISGSSNFILEVAIEGYGYEGTQLVGILSKVPQSPAPGQVVHFQIGPVPGQPLGNLGAADPLIKGTSLAVDPSIVKEGSTVTVPGYGGRTADDTGDAVVGHHVDVYEGFATTKPTNSSHGIVTLTALP